MKVVKKKTSTKKSEAAKVTKQVNPVVFAKTFYSKYGKMMSKLANE